MWECGIRTALAGLIYGHNPTNPSSVLPGISALISALLIGAGLGLMILVTPSPLRLFQNIPRCYPSWAVAAAREFPQELLSEWFLSFQLCPGESWNSVFQNKCRKLVGKKEKP